MIRGGLAALPRGQYEAADSLGLDYPQAMRLIILPQALKISIPGIVNVAVGLFKDTTLVSVISMFDLVGMIRGPILASTEWNGVYWELLGFAALLFFVVLLRHLSIFTVARGVALPPIIVKEFNACLNLQLTAKSTAPRCR